jgi:hypothetical protein
MEVRNTVLRQRWVKTDQGFFLDSESVLGGDASLLAARNAS